MLLTAPIFVIGYMRSGTTLLHSILAAHPAIFTSQGETKYFEYRPLFRRLYPDLNDDHLLESLVITVAHVITTGQFKPLRTASPGYRPASIDLPPGVLVTMIEQARCDRTYGGVFQAVFDQLTRQAGGTRWMEKTPQHTYFVEDILQAVPDAVFVEIVRDPRAVLASKKKRRAVVRTSERFSEGERRIQSLQRVYDPIWDTLAWRLAIRTVRRVSAHQPDRFLTLQYEHLITEPEANVRRLCDFLGLSFEPAMLDVQWLSTGDGIKADQRGFQTESLDRWKQVLGPAEIAICQRLAAEQMQQFGYEALHVPVHRQAGLPWLLIRSSVDVVRRLTNRWRLGGMNFLMTTVENYGAQLQHLLRRK